MFFRYSLILRSIKAYLCPNIINFDSVDFSERRPEEVIRRSVYVHKGQDVHSFICIKAANKRSSEV